MSLTSAKFFGYLRPVEHNTHRDSVNGLSSRTEDFEEEARALNTRVILIDRGKAVVMDNNLQSKIIGTVVAFFGWLAFIVLFLAFFPGNLDFWQNLAVFIASGSILICIIAVLWIRWTMR